LIECPECKERSNRLDVCTNCGLVFEDNPISNLPISHKNRFTGDKEYTRKFMPVLGPDIRYSHRGRKKYYKKDTEEYRYVKAYSEINRLASILRLSHKIINEALNIYKNIIKKDPVFFSKRKGGKSHTLIASYLAFLKIACDIHLYPIDIQRLFDLHNGKNDAKKLFEIYLEHKDGKKVICPHCNKTFKNEVGLRRHLNHLEKREIRKNFNKSYMDTLQILGLSLVKNRLRILRMKEDNDKKFWSV